MQVDDPQALAVQRAADSAVGIYFPILTSEGRRTPPPVMTGPDGTHYVDPEAGTHGRNYTVRHHVQRHGAELLDIDVVLHSRGPGTTWASTTGPRRTRRTRPRPVVVPAEPTTADWQLLVADLSGLPAVARIIEELPDGVPRDGDRRAADARRPRLSPRRRDVTVIPASAPETATPQADSRSSAANSRCPTAVATAGSPGRRRIPRRAQVPAQAGLDIDQYDITATGGSTRRAWDTRFAVVEDQVLAVYERALADGKGDKWPPRNSTRRSNRPGSDRRDRARSAADSAAPPDSTQPDHRTSTGRRAVGRDVRGQSGDRHQERRPVDGLAGRHRLSPTSATSGSCTICGSPAPCSACWSAWRWGSRRSCIQARDPQPARGQPDPRHRRGRRAFRGDFRSRSSASTGSGPTSGSPSSGRSSRWSWCTSSARPGGTAVTPVRVLLAGVAVGAVMDGVSVRHPACATRGPSTTMRFWDAGALDGRPLSRSRRRRPVHRGRGGAVPLVGRGLNAIAMGDDLAR